MENASKALSIAASVLIGVLLLALAVYAYYQIVEIPRQQEANAKVEQMAEFNKKYLAYDKKSLKGNKLISLLNMAEDNNKTYSDVPEYKINIIVNGKSNYLTEYSSQKNTGIRDEIKMKTYTCTNVTYASNGRVSSMAFDEI